MKKTTKKKEISKCCGAERVSSGISFDGTNAEYTTICKNCGGTFVAAQTKIKRWKLPIIRWALRQIKPLLRSLYESDFEMMSKFGIADMMENEHTKELAIYID